MEHHENNKLYVTIMCVCVWLWFWKSEYHWEKQDDKRNKKMWLSEKHWTTIINVRKNSLFFEILTRLLSLWIIVDVFNMVFLWKEYVTVNMKQKSDWIESIGKIWFALVEDQHSTVVDNVGKLVCIRRNILDEIFSSRTLIHSFINLFNWIPRRFQ